MQVGGCGLSFRIRVQASRRFAALLPKAVGGEQVWRGTGIGAREPSDIGTKEREREQNIKESAILPPKQ
jgi:hypothetical protein